MTRHFDIGRQGEVLLDKKSHDIFKTMENFLSPPNPDNPNSGPAMEDPNHDPIKAKSLWLDNYTDSADAEMKYYHNGQWNVIFKNKFKITDQITNSEQPTGAIQGQLWIDRDGVMNYFDKGVFHPIKAVQADIGDVELQGFDDFLIISPLEASENRVVDNFSEFLFKETPIVSWETGRPYLEHQGCIHDLHIYICVVEHTSSSIDELENKSKWIRLDFLKQFLVPNSQFAKVFLDGNFVHEKTGFDNNPEEGGYEVDTNICITFPTELVDNTVVSGTHVNPRRLKNVNKKVFMIDKSNPIIETLEENTEFYVIRDGVGKLLIKTDNADTTEYVSAISNNIECIKLSQSVADTYEFIYAVKYEFNDTNLSPKQKGVVIKKKFKISDENYIWVGSVPSSRLIVFAQGLHYENDIDNYIYNSETGYVYLKESLQDYENMTKRFDFTVLSMPEVFEGKVTDNFDESFGFRINLEKDPIGTNYLGFVGGVHLDPENLDILDDPYGNKRVKYIPSLTREIWLENNQNMYWAIAATNDANVSKASYEMYRGNATVVKDNSYGNVIKIYRDADHPVAGALHLATDEKPILFVDGILVFQKEIEVYNDCITIYGLQEGQNVLMLADTTNENTGLDDTDYDDHINSDRLLFEDTVSFATIPTDMCDDTLVFVQNGILCDAGATYTSLYPKEMGAHGEIRYVTTYSNSRWIVFDGKIGEWKDISEDLSFEDPVTGEAVRYTDHIDSNVRGYSRTRRSVSFLQRLDEQYCTYYAYRYADSIEKRLLMGYCYPDGQRGINILYPTHDDPQPFNVNHKHIYMPGKNELTVYLNGIRQNLDSPSDLHFNDSTNRECKDKNNNFILAHHNPGNTYGVPIREQDGYYVYHIEKPEHSFTINRKTELTPSMIEDYESQSYTVALASKPVKNIIFYVIEGTEAGEEKACTHKKLTWKDANASIGAFADNSYGTGEFLLTRGNIRVFINGIRQPYGGYQTPEALATSNRRMIYSYRIIDSRTIKFEEGLIGSMGGNENYDGEAMYPIGDIIQPDGTSERKYFTELDEIVIETRRDYKLREITLPILDNTGEFTTEDGVPLDLFKTKDKVMIYINGLAYGNKYVIDGNTIKLTDDDIRQQLGISKNDVITFEWR